MNTANAKTLLPTSDYGIVLMLTLGAFFLRVPWLEHGIGYHPDERHIVMVAQKLTWQDLNPHSFAYGSLLFYCLKGVAVFLSWWAPRMLSYENLFIVGRLCNAIFGALTVAIAYQLGLQLWKKREPAIIAGALLALNVGHLQLSHFYASDIPLTLFCTWALLFCVKIAKSGKFMDYMYFGVCMGLALAFKIAALSLLLPLVCAHILHALTCKDSSPWSLTYLVAGGIPLLWLLLLGPVSGWADIFQFAIGSLLLVLAAAWINQKVVPNSKAERSFLTLAATILCTITTFCACSPYAVLDSSKFIADVSQQISMVNGTWIPPYTKQYQFTTPFLYHLHQMGIFTMGWSVLTIGCLGILVNVLHTAISPRKVSHYLPPLLWMVAMFLMIGGKQVKFPRYLLPIYPIFLLYGGYFLYRARLALNQKGNLQFCLLGVVLVAVFVRAFALLGIYTQPHTYQQASAWIYENIPSRATILGVHWDDKIPLDLPGRSSHRFQMWGPDHELPLYEEDTESKVLQIARKMSTADYLVFPTDRLPGSILQVEQEYPRTSAFMRMLYSEDLGYNLVQTVKITPSFLGLKFPDLLADESLSVYDHPRVSIFKNEKRLSVQELQRRLHLAPPFPSRQKILAMERGSVFSSDVGGALLALVGWLVTWELIGIIGLSLLLGCCGHYPDRGYGLSKALGFFSLGFTVWALNVVGVPSTPLMVRITFLTLLIASAYSVQRSNNFHLGLYRQHFLPSTVLWYSCIALFLFTRALHPEIFWGEKPMDFSFLNYFTKSFSLPPEDPWAANHKMSYYYFGPYIMAMLAKLTGLQTKYLYNLSFGVLGGLIATTCCSTCSQLTGNVRMGLLGGLIMILSANPETLFITLSEFWEPLLATLSLGIPVGLGMVLLRLAKCSKSCNRTTSFGLLIFSVLTVGASFLLIGYCLYYGSQIKPSTNRNGFDLFWAGTRLFKSYGFSEYPLWSMLFADLHAHVIAMPFTTLLIGLSLACGNPDSPLSERILHRTLLGILLGSLFMLNVWDFITYSAFMALVLLSLLLLGLRQNFRLFIYHAPSFICIPLAAISVVTIFNMNSPTSQILHWGWVYRGELNNVSSHFRMFGYWIGLLAVSISWLVARDRITPSRIRLACAVLVGILPLCTPLGCWTLYYLTQHLHQAPLLSGMFSAHPFTEIHFPVPPTDSYPLLVYLLSGSMLFAAVIIESYHRWLAIFLLLIGGIFSGVETVFLIDRMNTTFKFFNAAWILCVIASITALGLFLKVASKVRPSRRSCLLSALLALAILSGGFNIIAMATHRRIAGFRPTLDGTAFLKYERSEDARLIDFLNKNFTTPIPMIEAHGSSYGDFGRISMYTGLPSYIGWEHHVKQRGLSITEFLRRTRILKTAYSSVDPHTTHALLREEGIRLVIVGPLEKRTYPAIGLRKFFNNPDLYTQIFEDNTNGIFSVNALAENYNYDKH